MEDNGSTFDYKVGILSKRKNSICGILCGFLDECVKLTMFSQGFWRASCGIFFLPVRVQITK